MPVYRTSGDSKYILFCPVCRNSVFGCIRQPKQPIYTYICSMCGGVHYSMKHLIACTEEELKEEMSFGGTE